MIVSDVYEDVREILGKDDQTIIFQRITDAVELLANNSGWDALIGSLEIEVTDGRVVVLPRDVETPLMINQNGYPGFMRNKWFEFHYNGPGSDRKNWDISGNLKEGPRPGEFTWDYVGRVPTFKDIVTPATLLATVNLREDLSKIIRVYGYDDSKEWIRSQLPDGTWQDGYIVPLRLETPSPTEIVTLNRVRNFTGGLADYLVSSTAHQYVTGEPVLLSLNTAPLPTPLVDSSIYYIRRIDSTHLSLHPTRSDAVNNTNIVRITAATSASVLQLADFRNMAVQTKFTSSINHNMLTGDPVTFSATTLPTGITNVLTYYINKRDANNFTIHSTPVDAEAGANAVNVSDSGSSVFSSSRQKTAPNTILTFAVNHNLVQGDSITVSNSGGALPSPLIPNTIYYVRYISTTSVSLHSTPSDASTGANPIQLTSAGSGTSSIVKIINASAIIGSSSNIRAQAHNLVANDYVQFSTSGTMPSAKVWEEPSLIGVAISAGADTVTPTGGNPYTDDSAVVFSGTAAPGNITFGTTYYVIAGTSTTFQISATIGGTAIDITSAGTAVQVKKVNGYGDVAPLVIGTIYKAVLPIGTDTFTLADINYNHVIDITSIGAGQLSLVITRAFLVGYTQTFNFTDADKLATGVPIQVDTDGSLPTASPALVAGTVYYIRLIDSATVELYDTEAHANGTPATTGRITISSLGTGQMYLVIKRSVTPAVFSSDLIAADNSFFPDGSTVRLITNGTLPSPLATGTDYYLEVAADNIVRIRDITTQDQIVLTDIGSGVHRFTIIQLFNVDQPTYFTVVSQPYETGDDVTASSTGTLPSPLATSTTYYVRILEDPNTIELYDTLAHATNLASTVGRITAVNSGSGVHSFLDTVDNIKVSKVERILRDATIGFGHLYAFDTGATSSPVAIGYYYPDETEPQYSKILLGLSSQYPTQTVARPTNVRIKYQRKTYKISSMLDYIPLRNKLAVAMACRAIDLFKTQHLDEGNSHMQQAIKFLEDKQDNDEGPNVTGMMFNSDTWTSPESTWMQ